MLSLAKCSWYPRYPRTYQALGAKLKVQRAWQELPDSAASKSAEKAPGSRSSVATGVTVLPQPTLVPGQPSSGLGYAQTSKPPPLPPAHFHPQGPQGKARAAGAFAFQSTPSAWHLEDLLAGCDHQAACHASGATHFCSASLLHSLFF